VAHHENPAVDAAESNSLLKLKLLEQPKAGAFLQTLNGCGGHISAGVTQPAGRLKTRPVRTLDPCVFSVVSHYPVSDGLEWTIQTGDSELGFRPQVRIQHGNRGAMPLS